MILKTNKMRATIDYPGRFMDTPSPRMSTTQKPWLLAFSIAFLSFYTAGPLLRFVDPSSAVLDMGALSIPILAALCLLGFIGLSLWLSGLLWPVFRQFRKYHFEHQFKSLEPWQKIFFYMAAFFLLLYACVCCLAAVM